MACPRHPPEAWVHLPCLLLIQHLLELLTQRLWVIPAGQAGRSGQGRQGKEAGQAVKGHAGQAQAARFLLLIPSAALLLGLHTATQLRCHVCWLAWGGKAGPPD
jgi:hypothetical protein